MFLHLKCMECSLCAIQLKKILCSLFEQEEGIKLWTVYLNCNINFHPWHMKEWHNESWGLCSQQDLLARHSYCSSSRHSCLSQFQSYPLIEGSAYTLSALLLFLVSSFVSTARNFMSSPQVKSNLYLFLCYS